MCSVGAQENTFFLSKNAACIASKDVFRFIDMMRTVNFCFTRTAVSWRNTNIFMFGTHERGSGKVMFAVMSVCSRGGPHVTPTFPVWTCSTLTSLYSPPPQKKFDIIIRSRFGTWTVHILREIFFVLDVVVLCFKTTCDWYRMHALWKCCPLLAITGRARLIRSHSSARFCFELSGNSN